ncbi:MAG: nucleotidyltransferase domain-containing protein [Chloroflexi bacterium]|nr:nucleotidyltransferase domain-containing protein [Chloroflexota bacterium]
MTEDVQNILMELKAELTKLYGSQLMQVYLFGSYARSEQDSESDMDVMIVLSHFASYSAEIDRTGKTISGISLKYDLPLSRVFVTQSDWQEGDTPLLRNVRQEAIPA